MMSTDPHPTSATVADTLTTTTRLLSHAADLAWARAERAPDPSTLGLALGLQLLASQALELLMAVDDTADVDEPASLETNPLELLRAAEASTRLHPIEDLPAGTSELVVAMCDLLRERAP